MTAAIRALYVVAIALLTVMTVAFGILTFYPVPDRPEHPVPPIAEGRTGPVKPTTDAEAETRYREELRTYDDQVEVRARVIMSVTMVLAVALILGGILGSPFPDVLRVGLMLGGIFTVVWGLGSVAGDSEGVPVFAVVAASMAALVVGGLRAPRGGSDLLGIDA